MSDGYLQRSTCLLGSHKVTDHSTIVCFFRVLCSIPHWVEDPGRAADEEEVMEAAQEASLGIAQLSSPGLDFGSKICCRSAMYKVTE